MLGTTPRSEQTFAADDLTAAPLKREVRTLIGATLCQITSPIANRQELKVLQARFNIELRAGNIRYLSTRLSTNLRPALPLRCLSAFLSQWKGR